MSQRLSISLQPNHIRSVERYGKSIGINSFSTALQALIHKFEELQREDSKDESPKAETHSSETVTA